VGPTGDEKGAVRLETVGARRAGADIVVQVVGRALNVALGVVATLVLVRALGDEDFGEWVTVFAIAEIVGFTGEWGLEQLAVRRAAVDREREAEWFGSLLTLRLLMSVPTALVLIVVLFVIADSTEMRATALIMAATMFTAAASSVRVIFQLRVRNDVAVVIMTLNSVLWTLAVVAIAGADGGMVAFAAAFLAAYVVTTGVQFVWALRTQPLRIRGSRRLWGGLVRAGVPLGVAGLLTLAYVRIDGVLVFQIAGADEAGLYGAVYRVLDRVQMVPTALMTTLLPIIAAAWPTDPDRTRRVIQRGADYLALVAFPALAFTIAVPEQIVVLLFGDEFRDAAPALPILMGAFVAISFWHLAMNMMIVLGRQARLVLYTGAGLIVNVILNLALIPSYGFLAAAWITLGTETLVMALTMATVLRETRNRLAVGRMARAALAAAVMGGVVALLAEAGAGIVALAVAAGALYAATVLVVRAFEVSDLQALLNRP
jgi:O-antigen/teichoic acid export membrane protein